MDLDTQSQIEELNDELQTGIQQLLDLETEFSEGSVDERGYDRRILFIKKQMAKTQRELDLLD